MTHSSQSSKTNSMVKARDPSARKSTSNNSSTPSNIRMMSVFYLL